MAPCCRTARSCGWKCWSRTSGRSLPWPTMTKSGRLPRSISGWIRPSACACCSIPATASTSGSCASNSDFEERKAAARRQASSVYHKSLGILTIVLNGDARKAKREIADEPSDGARGHAPPQARRPLFRGFRDWPPVRASTDAHGDADGQHVVLEHDAQSATAAYRSPFLRAGDRVGPTPDELAVHARADDRHHGHPPFGRHHHRQSRHDRGQIPAPAVRGRYRPLHERGHQQTRVDLASRRRNRGIPPSRLQSEQQARRRMPPPGLHAHATGVMRSLLFVPADGGSKLDKAMASGADAVIVDLEDSIAPDGKVAARKSAVDFLKQASQAASRPCLLVRVNAIATGLIDADLDAVVSARPDAIMLPKAEGGASIIHADAKLAVCEALGGLPDGTIKILAIATETAAALFRAGTYGG